MRGEKTKKRNGKKLRARDVMRTEAKEKREEKSVTWKSISGSRREEEEKNYFEKKTLRITLFLLIIINCSHATLIIE